MKNFLLFVCFLIAFLFSEKQIILVSDNPQLSNAIINNKNIYTNEIFVTIKYQSYFKNVLCFSNIQEDTNSITYNLYSKQEILFSNIKYYNIQDSIKSEIEALLFQNKINVKIFKKLKFLLGRIYIENQHGFYLLNDTLYFFSINQSVHIDSLLPFIICDIHNIDNNNNKMKFHFSPIKDFGFGFKSRKIDNFSVESSASISFLLNKYLFLVYLSEFQMSFQKQYFKYFYSTDKELQINKYHILNDLLLGVKINKFQFSYSMATEYLIKKIIFTEYNKANISNKYDFTINNLFDFRISNRKYFNINKNIYFVNILINFFNFKKFQTLNTYEIFINLTLANRLSVNGYGVFQHTINIHYLFDSKNRFFYILNDDQVLDYDFYYYLALNGWLNNTMVSLKCSFIRFQDENKINEKILFLPGLKFQMGKKIAINFEIFTCLNKKENNRLKYPINFIYKISKSFDLKNYNGIRLSI